MPLPPPITSRSNDRVKALRQSLGGESRKPGDLLGLEGWHLIREAHDAGLSFETIYLRSGQESFLSDDWYRRLRAKAWAVLSPEVFDSAVSTATPQGLAATWMIQPPQSRDLAPDVLVLEGIQDPGNLGTLLRSAFAFGASLAFVTPETVNQWNPKVVRAAAGAVFRVQVERLPLPEIFAYLRSHKVRSFAAVARFYSSPDEGMPVVAAPHGVLFGRRNNFEAASSRYSTDPGLDTWKRDAENTYPASLSYDTDFDSPCAFLVGNEGAGLSLEARCLADEQVMIPSQGESLNAAVAGSILLYEAKRQIHLRAWARKQGLRS